MTQMMHTIKVFLVPSKPSAFQTGGFVLHDLEA
jgi:hypothetical protein